MTHVINPQISSKQRYIIIGTILGGSSIVRPNKGKNCYLSMRSKDLDWLNYKSKELYNLSLKDSITKEKTYRWHSICYPLFNEFEDLFYKNKKRCLQEKALSSLRETSIAVWYKDCGVLNKNKIILNTHIWGEEGTNMCLDYFKSIDYEAEIYLERKNYRLKFSEKSSKEFLNLYETLIKK